MIHDDMIMMKQPLLMVVVVDDVDDDDDDDDDGGNLSNSANQANRTQTKLNCIDLRCFDTVFRRPYRYFSIALKMFFSLIAIKFSPVIGYGLKFVKM